VGGLRQPVRARDLPRAGEHVQRIWWGGLIDQTKYYLFLKPTAQPWQGHNPLAMAAMFFMYLLGTVFMILTGFALYGEGTGHGQLGLHSGSRPGCCRCWATA
jgi:Ni,Fe-hydrogenase I cytochrome b subunit